MKSIVFYFVYGTVTSKKSNVNFYGIRQLVRRQERAGHGRELCTQSHLYLFATDRSNLDPSENGTAGG